MLLLSAHGQASTVAPRGESGLRVWVQQQLLCCRAYVLRVSWGVSSKRDGVFDEHCDQAARPSNLDFAGEEAGTASDWSDRARQRSFRGAAQAAPAAWRPSRTTRCRSTSGRSPRGTCSAPPRLQLNAVGQSIGLSRRPTLVTYAGNPLGPVEVSECSAACCSQ